MIRIILFISFGIIAILHFYWALGGKWALAKVLPNDLSGQFLFLPKTSITLFIATVLLLISVFFLKQDYFSTFISKRGITLVTIAIGILFLLRAIGELKYVGLFKSIDSTQFGKLDTFIYSPFCLVIAILCFIESMK